MLFAFIVTGCKHNDAQTPTETAENAMEKSIQITNSKNKMLIKITDAAQIAAIDAIFAKKEKVLYKMLPFFDYQITFDGKGEQVWQMSSKGVIQLKDSDDTQLYQIDLAAIKPFLSPN